MFRFPTKFLSPQNWLLETGIQEGGRALLEISHGLQVYSNHRCVWQAAKILMLQREEKEAPSDFQDYTLLALVAVSAFLSNSNLGERHGLVALARKYDENVEPLQQVTFPPFPPLFPMKQSLLKQGRPECGASAPSLAHMSNLAHG